MCRQERSELERSTAGCGVESLVIAWALVTLLCFAVVRSGGGRYTVSNIVAPVSVGGKYAD